MVKTLRYLGFGARVAPSGNNYKLVLDRNRQQLTIFDKVNRVELARFDTANNSVLFASGITESDRFNWSRIQEIIHQTQTQRNSTQSPDFEL
ncbi:hypothetical protein [Chroococcidiopsis thermalis]|uniref:hypothetical protein n=1 Tax=Chroococcidiopsis thermalis TaxID=54299 RepID=UPI00030EBCF5|nr:hypothetical protein [Chroococcidiopsis thermalis]